MNRLPVNWLRGKQKESIEGGQNLGGQDRRDRREEKVALFSKFQDNESRKKKEKTERCNCCLHDRQDLCWGEIASRDTVKNCIRRNGGRRRE